MGEFTDGRLIYEVECSELETEELLLLIDSLLLFYYY
jgi:hypothetical protein